MWYESRVPRGAASCLLAIALVSPVAARCPDYSKLKNAYFGDLHTHSSYSLDAFNFGTRADPAQAYAFATGAAVDLTQGYNPRVGETPGPFGVTIDFSGGRLDFGAVTDHSEWLAIDYGCTVDGSSQSYRSPYCAALRGLEVPTADQEPCLGSADHRGTGCMAEQTTAWAAERQATEAANDPCRFTSFHAYEWTYSQGVFGRTLPATLHKNVIFRNANVPSVPLDSVNYPTGPVLWAALAQQCNDRNGCEALTIPHNMNQSAGLAFDVNGYTATDLNHMIKFQRLAEIHQQKGNSECGTDAVDGGAAVACDFETVPLHDPADARGFARSGLEQGIASFATRNYDPHQFGFVGASDTHNATMGNVGSRTWPGSLGAIDNTPARRLQWAPLGVNPGGITGIWAEENTRDALWAALQRRETFATSGPKIRVRFYEYARLNDPCADPRFPLRIVKRGGVPMGGTMAYRGTSPRFVVYALQDETPLDSVDIVKASVVSGRAEEAVFPLPLGDAPYCLTWTDPAFDQAEPAFYYARVEERPTWRWSHYDCERLRASDPDWRRIAPGCASDDPSKGGMDFMVQQRAWTSSIWYLPGGPVTVQATALTLRDDTAAGEPSRRRFVFRSRTRADTSDHRIAVPRPGSIGDPTVNGIGGGGTLTVFNPESGEAFAAVLPAARWKLRGRSGYVFDDPGGAVRKVVVSRDRLSVTGGGSGFGYALDEPRQGSVAVRLQLGTAQPWCSEVRARPSGKPPTTARNDTIGRFIGRPRTPPPDQCPVVDTEPPVRRG